MSNISIGNLNDNYFSIDFAGKTDPTDTYRFNRLNTGSFRVTAEGFSSIVGMQLLDSQGKVVKDMETNGTNSGTFSIDNLGATNYALKISAPAGDTNYQVSLTPDGKVDPLTGLGVDSGFFATDSTGKVGFDWLHDGGNYQGEVAIFSVQGMEKFTPGSEEFIKEAARRALSNSLLGHVVISGPTEGANPLFNGSLGEGNDNEGQYSGQKTFAMKPGEAFAVMLVPNGTVQDVFDNPNAGGDKRPLLSLSSSNPDDAWLYGQVADVTGSGKAFAMEDQLVDTGSDKDYNDLVFNLTGATGKAVSIDKVIDPAKDWTKLDGGKKLIDYVKSKQPIVEPPVAVGPPVQTKPPVAVGPPIETKPPVAVTPPVATGRVETKPPVAVAPPVETPPVAVAPPIETTPSVATLPVATTPPVATLPSRPPTPPVQPPPVAPEAPLVGLEPIDVSQQIDPEPRSETVLPISSPPENRAFIGIIDTGFAANNPDLDYSKVILGRDRIDKDSNPLFTAGSGNEHGTFSWGLVSAIQGNDKGIDGYNDKANVYLSRAIGSGEWDLALTDFVSEAKAQKQKNAIALLPLDLTQKNADGSITTRYEFTPRERAALENARQNGVLLVVAAGNDGGVMSVLGQSSQEFENILTVGSSDGFGRSDYSSYGYGLDILVPGGAIDNPTLSTVGDDLGTMSGTSASAAIAAGMASKVWESNPDLSVTQVIDVLTGSAIDLKEPGWDEETGFGVVNLNKAVQLAKETAPQAYIPTPFSNPTTWGLEGLVTPLERATADQFNGKYYDWVSYTIQSGDTLSQIALDTMGDASPDYYNFIAQHNGIANPDEIFAGQEIQIPQEVSAPPQQPPTNDNPNVDFNPDNQNVDFYPDDNQNVDFNPPQSNSINLNGYTIGNNFYPVFQNYQGTLGNPTSDVINYNGASYQLFENGSIVSSANGTFPLYGGIRQTYKNTGALEGWLGAPKSEEKGLGDGNIIQYFEHGHIYWNGSKAIAYEEGKETPTVQKPNNTPIQSSGSGANSPILTAQELANSWQNWPEYSSNNPFPDKGQNCTWYAHGRMLQLGYSKDALNSMIHHAGTWDNEAGNGATVSNTPQAPCIAVWEIGVGGVPSAIKGGVGHVAVVERVNPDGSILISESNWADTQYNTRTISPSDSHWPSEFVIVPSNSGSIKPFPVSGSDSPVSGLTENFSIGNLEEGWGAGNSVSAANPSDFYSFNIDKRSNLQADFTTIDATARLSIIPEGGGELKNFIDTSGSASWILEPGNYQIKIEDTSGDADYNFGLHRVNLVGDIPDKGLTGRLINGNWEKVDEDKQDFKNGVNLYRYDNNGQVTSQGIEAGKNTILVTHGRGDSVLGPNIQNLLKTLAGKYGNQGYQVLGVDWNEPAKDWKQPPFDAARRITPVAEWTKNTLDKLGIVAKQVSLFGHSLGAYVTAEIGQLFGKVENLVAIDPAWPGNSYDIDGNTAGSQRAPEFKDTANHSLAFVVKEDEGGIAGDGHTADKAHNSLVISYEVRANPLYAESLHNTAVDVVADALSKPDGLKLEDNLALPIGFWEDKYGDDGYYVRWSGTHEGRVTATREGKIKELAYINGSNWGIDQETTAWT